MLLAGAGVLLLALALLGRPVHTAPQGPKLYSYEVVAAYPHDPEAFTQGLQYDTDCRTAADGKEECREIFWESTGHYGGRSTVRKVELHSGKVLAHAHLGHRDFGEGLTRMGNRLYQLTWRQPTVYSYHINNFEDVEEKRTQLRDGWGLAANGSALVATDSGDQLYFLDPATFATLRSVTVHDGDRVVRWPNELEWVGGEVWANVWQTDCLARIDPADGSVVGWVLLHGLSELAAKGTPARHRNAMDVLNGIAHDEAGGRLFVTGKQWPKLFEVRLVETTAGGAEREQQLAEARQKCIV